LSVHLGIFLPINSAHPGCNLYRDCHLLGLHFKWRRFNNKKKVHGPRNSSSLAKYGSHTQGAFEDHPPLNSPLWHDPHNSASLMCRVDQDCISTPYMTVHSAISLLKIPNIHRIYMVLANPTHVHLQVLASVADNSVRVWSAACGTQLHLLKAHTDQVM